MLAELSIYPLGVGAHTSSTLADILQIVDLSRIPYVLTPSGTCIEGEWEEIMTLVNKCPVSYTHLTLPTILRV